MSAAADNRLVVGKEYRIEFTNGTSAIGTFNGYRILPFIFPGHPGKNVLKFDIKKNSVIDQSLLTKTLDGKMKLVVDVIADGGKFTVQYINYEGVKADGVYEAGGGNILLGENTIGPSYLTRELISKVYDNETNELVTVAPPRPFEQVAHTKLSRSLHDDGDTEVTPSSSWFERLFSPRKTQTARTRRNRRRSTRRRR